MGRVGQRVTGEEGAGVHGKQVRLTSGPGARRGVRIGRGLRVVLGLAGEELCRGVGRAG